MPRIRRSAEVAVPVRFPKLVDELAEELRSERESGQPRIEEQVFPRTNGISVNVLWDKWDPVPDEERVASIRRAYERAEGKEYADRIVLCMGLTFPEAFESGMLPYQVLTALRKGDPVTDEQCTRAMIEEGASLLFDPAKPQLRFATEEEAQASVKRLAARLPGSEGVWVVVRDAGTLAGRAGESAAADLS